MKKQDNFIIVATTNKDRFIKTKRILNRIAPQLKVKSLFDFKGIDIVLETRDSERQNAISKARCYWERLKHNTLSIDVGIYLDGFKEKDQPGAYVHRINQKEKNAGREEIFDYWYEIVKKHPGLKGRLKRAIVLCSKGKIFIRQMTTKVRFILPKTKPKRISENPLNHFMIPEGFVDSFHEMKKEVRIEYEAIIAYNIDCLLKDAQVLE